MSPLFLSSFIIFFFHCRDLFTDEVEKEDKNETENENESENKEIKGGEKDDEKEKEKEMERIKNNTVNLSDLHTLAKIIRNQRNKKERKEKKGIQKHSQSSCSSSSSSLPPSSSSFSQEYSSEEDEDSLQEHSSDEEYSPGVHILETSMINCYGLKALHTYIRIPYLRMKKMIFLSQLKKIESDLKQQDRVLRSSLLTSDTEAYVTFVQKYENKIR